MSLMAMGEIHKAFYQQSLSLESAVTLTSPVATLVLSRLAGWRTGEVSSWF